MVISLDLVLMNKITASFTHGVSRRMINSVDLFFSYFPVSNIIFIYMHDQSLVKLSFIYFFFKICQVIELVIFKQSTCKL